METEEVKKYLKYYKGEETNPFQPISLQYKWWEGEKMLAENVSDDKQFWNRLENKLNEAVRDGMVSGYLIDKTVPIEKRAICFYLDLWNGKNFPYDSLDDIFEYIKSE